MSERPPPTSDSEWVPPGAAQPVVPVQPPYGGQQPAPGYGYPPPIYQGAPPPPREPNRTLAIVALVLAVVPCGITWIVAAVLAVIVLVQVKKGTALGRRLAIAALALSVLWLLALTLGMTLVVKEARKYHDARAASEGTVGSNMLRAGDCLAVVPSGQEIDTVEITPCSKPHLGEVYAKFAIDDASHLSQERIHQLADAGCRTRLEDYVGDGPGVRLRYGFLAPDEESFYDDDITCYLFSGREEPSTGSLKGSRE